MNGSSAESVGEVTMDLAVPEDLKMLKQTPVWPVDCYNEQVRAQRDRMLPTEAG